jgi:hypothetical protein
MTLVVDGPHTVWADFGGGNGRKRVDLIPADAITAASYKISEGRGYIDPNAQYHHDAVAARGAFQIPYTFPLPASCGMSVTDQAKRDADLYHRLHGSFERTAFLIDCELEPGGNGWGPFLIGAGDVGAYVATLRGLTGCKIVGYTGYQYRFSNTERFDARVIPSYSCPAAWYGMVSLDEALRVKNGGVTFMPGGGAWRQFTDAVNVGGSYTDFNIAAIPPAQFLQVLTSGGHVVDPPVNPNTNRYGRELTIAKAGTPGNYPHDDNVLPVGQHPVKDFQSGINLAAGRGLVVDGQFGTESWKAACDFQKFFGLPIDGIVGPKTWATLDLVLDKQHR